MEYVLIGGLVLLVVLKLLQPRRPSKLRQGLWAHSVRKRGLSEKEALREAYVLGYVKEPPRD